MRRQLVAAAALAAAANAWVLAGVLANRRGEPEARLVLTERELPLAWSSPQGESSLVALRIQESTWTPWAEDPRQVYRHFSDRHPSDEWLDEARLAELGFDVALPADPEEAAAFAARQLDRRCFAAYEQEGPAFAAREAWARRRLAELGAAAGRGAKGGGGEGEEVARREARWLQQSLVENSRLYLVDAGPDPGVLRRRHADRARTVILPARARVFVGGLRRDEPCLPGSCRLHGAVAPAIDEVDVPARLQPALAAARRPRPAAGPGQDGERDDPPRYEVVLRTGSRYEPWIESIRPLDPAP